MSPIVLQQRGGVSRTNYPGRRHDATIVTDAPLAIEDGDIEPRIVGAITGSPNHGSNASISQVHVENGLRANLCRLEAMRRGETILLRVGFSRDARVGQFIAIAGTAPIAATGVRRLLIRQ
jgi:hypothetical protein